MRERLKRWRRWRWRLWRHFQHAEGGAFRAIAHAEGGAPRASAGCHFTPTAGKGETWAASPDGPLLAVGRRDADTNGDPFDHAQGRPEFLSKGDGVINGLDACRLYRMEIQGGKAGPPQALVR